MQTGKQYRAYAEECRRLAKNMTQKDSKILVEMAQVWEERAQEAERKDGKQQHDGGIAEGR